MILLIFLIELPFQRRDAVLEALPLFRGDDLLRGAERQLMLLNRNRMVLGGTRAALWTGHWRRWLELLLLGLFVLVEHLHRVGGRFLA